MDNQTSKGEMRRMTNPVFIGIDPGNSACKYVFLSNGRIIYGQIPNVIGPAVPLTIPPVGLDEDVLAVRGDFIEQPIFLGKLALNQLQDAANQDRSRDKAMSENVLSMIPTVLGIVGDSAPFVLGVGATLTDFAEQSPALKKRLTRKYEVEFAYGSKAGKVLRPEVVKTYTYPQAAAGLLGMMRSIDGSVNRLDWMDKTVIALDFGHGQVNVAVMKEMGFIQDACFSLDYGCYRLVTAVQEFLNAKPYYITASIPQLQKAVEDGFYVQRGKSIDLLPIIEDAAGKLVDMVYREVSSRVPKVLLDEVSAVVTMGGGAWRMNPFVGAKFYMIPEVAEKNIYANAVGLLLAAREKWGKENAT